MIIVREPFDQDIFSLADLGIRLDLKFIHTHSATVLLTEENWNCGGELTWLNKGKKRIQQKIK